MHFNVRCLAGLFSLALTLPSIYFSNTSTLLSDVQKCEQSVDADGLYMPEIRALYNSTRNEGELFLTENYQTYYFNKLGNNTGNNLHDSCGFVATGTLLSFRDTYWDDKIIPENFDAATHLNEEYIDLFVESPGIIQEPEELVCSDIQMYDNNIHKYANNYFHFKLIDLFSKNISSRGPGKYRMGYQNYIDLFNYYVYNFLGFSSSDVEIIYSDVNVRSQTIDLIKGGIPVKLSIGGHAVVAYDYDEKTDNIYCNFGWGPNTTHVTIEQMGYSQYANLVAFNFKTNHINHSNNYTYINNYGENATLCSCWSFMPKEVIVTSGNYLDDTPTYKRGSLIREKWHINLLLHYTFKILDSNQRALFEDDNVYTSKYEINEDTWALTLNSEGNYYYIYIGFKSLVDPYWDDYYCLTKIYEPKDYSNKVQIKPSDWGFEKRYWFANEGDNGNEYKESSLTVKGLKITSQRLRCGYIEEQYVNLSPRREGAGEAYLRLKWDKPVYSYMFGASYWSSAENLNGEAIARVMFKDGSWQSTKYADFNLKTIGLSTKRSNIKRFVKKHSEGIYGLEFYITSEAIGNRNKGRICIDDIVLNNDPYDLEFISTNYSSIG